MAAVDKKDEEGKMLRERQGCCCQSRSLSRIETQDIKTQPQFNHYLDVFLFLTIFFSSGAVTLLRSYFAYNPALSIHSSVSLTPLRLLASTSSWLSRVFLFPPSPTSIVLSLRSFSLSFSKLLPNEWTGRRRRRANNKRETRRRKRGMQE